MYLWIFNGRLTEGGMAHHLPAYYKLAVWAKMPSDPMKFHFMAYGLSLAESSGELPIPFSLLMMATQLFIRDVDENGT